MNHSITMYHFFKYLDSKSYDVYASKDMGGHKKERSTKPVICYSHTWING